MTPEERTVVYDQITSTTWYKVRKMKFDAVFQITPYYDMMAKKGRIRQREPAGGTHFQVPIRYAKMDQNIQYIGRGTKFAIGEKETLTHLRYPVRSIASSMIRYYQDDRINRGKSQIMSYVEELVDNTMMSLEDAFAKDFLVTNSDPLAIHSLDELISTTPTTGTLGGANRSKFAILQNQIKNFSGLTVEANLLDEMRKMVNECSKLKLGANRRPDLILTTQNIYEQYQSYAEDLRIIESNTSDRVSLGFGDMAFQGIEMYWDPECPTGKMFFINTATMEIPYDPEEWFWMGSWTQLPQRRDRWAPIVTTANQICNNCAKNGVIYNIPHV